MGNLFIHFVVFTPLKLTLNVAKDVLYVECVKWKFCIEMCFICK